jgi:hypothetical protein
MHNFRKWWVVWEKYSRKGEEHGQGTFLVGVVTKSPTGKVTAEQRPEQWDRRGDMEEYEGQEWVWQVEEKKDDSLVRAAWGKRVAG